MGSNDLAIALAPFKNFPHYAPRCLKIRTKTGEIKPFVMNKAQWYAHEQMEKQKRETGKVRALILKGRQQGISTLVEGRGYHYTSTNPGKRGFILTHLAEATDNLFAMTKRYHENCPFPLKPSTQAVNAKALIFDKLDSEISVATAGSKGTGRSATAQFFHGSEVAFWPNAKEHMAGIGQIVPNADDTEIILESTGNGEGNMFHGMCIDAMRGKGDYILVFIPWFWQSEYQLPVPPDFVMDADEAEYAQAYDLQPEQVVWRRSKIRDDFRGDAALFDQEYPAEPLLAFRRQAVESYIPAALVAKARKTRVELDENAPKIMGVDPAEYGDDDTAIIKRQGRKAFDAERHHKRGPMEVVGIVAKRADAWGPDAINVDCTGVGSGIADRLLELGYPVNRVHFGESPIERDQYVIRKDEIWGETKVWLMNDPCELPDNDALQADLTGPGYTYDSSRRLKLESKEQMKKRGLKSPDSGDALALTFAVSITPEHLVNKLRPNRERRHDPRVL